MLNVEHQDYKKIHNALVLDRKDGLMMELLTIDNMHLDCDKGYYVHVYTLPKRLLSNDLDRDFRVAKKWKDEDDPLHNPLELVFYQVFIIDGEPKIDEIHLCHDLELHGSVMRNTEQMLRDYFQNRNCRAYPSKKHAERLKNKIKAEKKQIRAHEKRIRKIQSVFEIV